MAPTKKPTDKQIYTLVRNYESFLYDAMDDANRKGAWRTADAIQEAIDEHVIHDAITTITDARIISRAIANSCTSEHQLIPEVKTALAIFFEQRGVWVDLNWQSVDRQN